MIEKLRNKLNTLALLDAIIEQEWQYRYFSYNPNWSETEEMGSLRDGCGGEWFLWLSEDLAGYKCTSPEDGLMDDLDVAKSEAPNGYSAFITEPAFSMGSATCIWYLVGSEWVKYGKPVSYLIDLDTIFNWQPGDYHTWATEYYEREIDFALIERIFNGEFSEEIAKSLNPSVEMDELLSEMPEIGFKSQY